MRRTELVIHELLQPPAVILPPANGPNKGKRSQSPKQIFSTQPQIHRGRYAHLALKKRLISTLTVKNDPLLTVQSALQPTEMRPESVSPIDKKKNFFLMRPSRPNIRTGLKTISVLENFPDEGVILPKELSSPFKLSKNGFLRDKSFDSKTEEPEFLKLGTGISLQHKQVQSPRESSFRITLRKPFVESVTHAAKKDIGKSTLSMSPTQRQTMASNGFQMKDQQQTMYLNGRSISCTEKSEHLNKRRMFAGNRAAEPNRQLIKNINTSSLVMVPPLESEVNNLFKATLYQAQNLFFRSAASGNSSPLKKKSIFMDIDGIISSLINRVECSLDIRTSVKPELPIIFLRTDSMDFLCELKAQHNIYLIAPRTVPEVILGKIIHKLTGFGVRGIILKGSSKEITDYREVLTSIGLHKQPSLHSVHALPQELNGSLTAESEQQIMRAVSDVYPSAVRVSHIFCSHLYMDIPAHKFLDQDLGSEVGLITVSNSTLTNIVAGLKHPAPFRIGQKESGRLLYLLLNERMLVARQQGIEAILQDLGVLQGKERTLPFPLTHEEYRYSRRVTIVA